MARIAEEAKKEAETIKKELSFNQRKTFWRWRLNLTAKRKKGGVILMRGRSASALKRKIWINDRWLAQKESSIDGREKLITNKEAVIEENVAS